MKIEMQPKVSIIIPCYNVEKTISQCLESILSQCSQSIEIICVDDGSTDNTKYILENYEKQICIISVEHSGVSNARNIGMHNANGKWIWFVDADDMLCEDAFLWVKQYWNEDVDVLFFGCIVKNCLPDKSKLPGLTPENDMLRGDDVFLVWITRYYSPYIWNCIYNKKFLNENRINFAPYLILGEDMAFQMSVFLRAATVITVSEPIYLYRYLYNSNSTMSKMLGLDRTPYHIDVLDEILRENSQFLDKDKQNLLYTWAYGYVIEKCFKDPQYLKKLQKVWKKYKAKFPFKGYRNRIKAIILKSVLMRNLYIIYKKIA